MTGTTPAIEARYRLAGAVYVVAGLVVIGVTLGTPGMTGPDRASEIGHLAAALPVFLAFGAAVAWGDRLIASLRRWAGVEASRAAASGRAFRRGLATILMVTAVGRTLVFAANAAGLRPRFRGGFGFDATLPEPGMLLAAAGTATIAIVLGRAVAQVQVPDSPCVLPRSES